MGEVSAIAVYKSFLNTVANSSSESVCNYIKNFINSQAFEDLKQYKKSICSNSSLKGLYMTAVGNAIVLCMNSTTPVLTSDELAELVFEPCPCWGAELVISQDLFKYLVQSPSIASTSSTQGIGLPNPAQTTANEMSTAIGVLTKYLEEESDECGKLCLQIVIDLLSTYDPNKDTVDPSKAFSTLKNSLSTLEKCRSTVEPVVSAFIAKYGSSVKVGNKTLGQYLQDVALKLSKLMTVLDKPLSNAEQVKEYIEGIMKDLNTAPVVKYALSNESLKVLSKALNVYKVITELEKEGVKPEEVVSALNKITSGKLTVSDLKKLSVLCLKLQSIGESTGIQSLDNLLKFCTINSSVLGNAYRWEHPDSYLAELISSGRPSGIPAPPSVQIKLLDGSTVTVKIHEGVSDLQLLNCEVYWAKCVAKNPAELEYLKKLVQVLPAEQAGKVNLNPKCDKSTQDTCIKYWVERLKKKDSIAKVLNSRLLNECTADANFKQEADRIIASMCTDENCSSLGTLLTDPEYADTLIKCDGSVVDLSEAVLESTIYNYKLPFFELWKRKVVAGLLDPWLIFRL